MINVERTFVVGRPVAFVVDYLKDFSRTEQWDPGTRSCTRLDAGPVRAGSTWRNVSEFKGRETELEYELTRLEPARLVFVGRNRTAGTTDDLAFRSVDGGATEVRYRAGIEFHGVARLASPFLRGEFERLGDAVAERMPAVIQAL
ncbi:polyketide cyclase [Streptacidiphilus sp. PB12-B1b]|uniref:SRPBCC family protein n=1 Tax=Streptacidiphilus sp. PB12-B1b TaxID=2705012 RepID=UPI0015FE1244|nr:SRPBCC family protein [Streptacidiphilus sp. PB12-B1b]QMU76521.1 polyketide cyclase [Streptacidiphilus sp. PB12-B1b]